MTPFAGAGSAVEGVEETSEDGLIDMIVYIVSTATVDEGVVLGVYTERGLAEIEMTKWIEKENARTNELVHIFCQAKLISPSN